MWEDSDFLKSALERLPVVALDCQTTGGSPSQGGLLEIGWLFTWAQGPFEAADFKGKAVLVHQKNPLAPRIARLTGIQASDLQAAMEPAQIWTRLVSSAHAWGQSHDLVPPWPAVIHFARFELSFFERLHQQTFPEAPFPFAPICTYEIVRRLLPGLPSKGIRGCAGYFGHSVPAAKRCAHHLSATEQIWRHCVQRLQTESKVATLSQLLDWLARPLKPNRRAARTFAMSTDIRQDIPGRPGLYFLRHANGDLLYIGKAKSLRARVHSYFRPNARLAGHIREMISQAARLDTTVCATALEAALLESDEIKRHQPPYNRALLANPHPMGPLNPDFEPADDDPAAHFAPGPVIYCPEVQMMAALKKMRAGTDGIDDLYRQALSFFSPGRPGPEPEIFAEGTARFLDQFAFFQRTDLSDGGWLNLGAYLWAYRIFVSAKKQNSQTPAPDSGEGWDEDKVCRLLAGAVRRAAHLVRRAAWFAQLREAAFGWQQEKDRWRWLFLKNAAISETQWQRQEVLWKKKAVPPAPAARRHRFDIADYDRMRILTTEMRRLLAEKRALRLFFSSGRTWDQRALASFLFWI